MSGVFHMKVLGRTIEHLGTQMYKHRAPSIAELIANCWDAGAKNAWITVPSADQYSQGNGVIAGLPQKDLRLSHKKNCCPDTRTS